MLTASCLLMLPCTRMRIGGRARKNRISLSVYPSVCLSVHSSIYLSVSICCAYLVVLPDQEGMELGEEGRLANELLCQWHMPSKSVGIPIYKCGEKSSAYTLGYGTSAALKPASN